jgi:hypothetical protein
MNYFSKIFKVDVWWKFILLLSVAIIACTLLIDIYIVNPKHLLGLGIGLLLIGVSCFIANKHINASNGYEVVSTERIIHNTTTLCLFVLGIIIAALFFILIIISLI